MKLKINKLPFIFILLTVLFYSSSAQWQQDVRLTNDPAASNNGRCTASINNIVHVIWYDSRDGNTELYYKRSTNAGSSWGADTRLTSSSGSSVNPSIAVYNSFVSAVWEDNRDGNWEIYYNHSTDAGVTWGTDTRLTNNSSISTFASVTVSGAVVFAVWQDERDGNKEIYSKISSDGGVSWGTDVRLTNNTGYSAYPSVSLSGTVVLVVWHDDRDGNREIYCKRSSDGGLSWGADMRLTVNSAISSYPALAVSGSVFYLVWQDNRDGNYEIYYKRSTNGGLIWDSDLRLTNNSAVSVYSAISISGSIVHLAWQDNRDGNYEIYYKQSIDGGMNWESDIRLTDNAGYSYLPSISVLSSAVHIVWFDNRDGNDEVYYKCNPTGNFVGIKNENQEIPGGFSLYQNFPNPFNPATNIRFDIPKSAFVKLLVYDILGKEISSLVNEQLNAGSYNVNWSGINLSNGVYIYKLKTDDFTQTKKMVLVK